jgi:hypothetical protein
MRTNESAIAIICWAIMADKLMNGLVVLFRRVKVKESLPTFVIWARNSHASV